MLREIPEVRQIPGEPNRRWFVGDTMELIVWSEPGGEFHGFQLCYREGTEQKALTWDPKTGFTHRKIDSGEGRPFRHKMTPILVPDGRFDKANVRTRFEEESSTLDAGLAARISERLRSCPDDQPLH